MKTRQPELRAIPQFDSGRWKLRLERVPVDPDNETAMGVDFDSAHKRGSTRPMRRIGSRYRSSAAAANDKTSCRTNREATAISEPGANNSKPVPAEPFK